MPAEAVKIFNLDGTPWRAAEPEAVERAHAARGAALASLHRRGPNPLSLDEGEE